MIQRLIPSSGESLPVIGLGTWQSFDVDPKKAEPQRKVLEIFKNSGATLIDSSPMYGKAEEAIGELTKDDVHYFMATKVWTKGRKAGISQMEDSFRKLKRSRIDLMQVHNLVDWEVHLDTLNEWKDEGRIRYTGITHYTDGMHADLEKILKKVKVDFVQFNYSIDNTHAERTLLPAAADKGVATLINRPFGEGRLFRKSQGKNLPDWIKDWGISNWSQFFLKFILSHPAVTCVIPATSDPAHASDNLTAGSEPLPDEKTRIKMAELIQSW
jgi:diketogulonate reductase-like aldo/keto reductase